MCILVLVHIVVLFLLIIGIGALVLEKIPEFAAVLICTLTTTLYAAIGIGHIDKVWKI